MSSPKDYILETYPDLKELLNRNNLVKFTVRPKPGIFIKYVKLPLLIILSTILITYLTYLFKFGGYCSILASQLNHKVIVLSSMIMITYCWNEAEDSMTVIKDLGIQLHSSPKWRFFKNPKKSNQNFIPSSDIMDIVIHDIFHGYGQTIFCLYILMKSGDQKASYIGGIQRETNLNPIKVIFPQLMPRKKILLEVYYNSRKVLFGDQIYWRKSNKITKG
ncbi:hypothetical protein HYPBUDRAFT_103467 [Hyphopichia burtonii NRRL Y-1933]|uniref:Phosphatidylinositol N-acetylglucosaminyltransferase subunit H conserved domain-containing protein n=1 Tax=Hyphopichia burtonii NRRL Y-1933 TaxID=984485 RepID=A0A1E4RSN7_9ASCO|nr:hypothetical protein HYPBUDRAFT_103467 [Hyphopichia burtonii NRRL Y-1933]ODV70294.1 hypothetical protein HYPBUDRAFT_103467 [Hyphopichia burtonii NRRL Y-1933]